MSLPLLLLVDDSEAVLAYESAALAGEYATATAANGEEALRKAAELGPAAILLDLSMPVAAGEEVIERLRASATLRDIPVVVVSSEEARARVCLGMGAAAYLPKPVRAADLRAAVARVLDAAREKRRRASLAVLAVVVGSLEVGIPLGCVETAVPMPATAPLPAGPSYLRELIDFHGTPVCVLDLAARLGTGHSADLVDRKLVLVTGEGGLLAVAVDRIRDPEEFLDGEFVPREAIAGAEHGLLREALEAIVRPGDRSGAGGKSLPIIDPRALLSRGLLRSLPTLLRSAATTPS